MAQLRHRLASRKGSSSDGASPPSIEDWEETDPAFFIARLWTPGPWLTRRRRLAIAAAGLLLRTIVPGASQAVDLAPPHCDRSPPATPNLQVSLPRPPSTPKGRARR